MRLILLSLALLLSTAAWAAEKLPTFPKNTDYREARRSLIGLGYKPVTLPDSDKCSPGDGRCEGYPEMASCAGTGLGQCLFIWRSPTNALIEIVTVGENNPGVSAIRCRANCR
ncbi:hypothetical protein [Bosea sp. ASV33]|uniref:hypothetical protein n=1 Tax=Bosea sp. ASV33 TaxID=2795106 RepID=UPI0018EE2B0F|nr:hypothetical protein [Bosea sp. ASV33]